MSGHTSAPWSFVSAIGAETKDDALDIGIAANSQIIAECFGRTGEFTIQPVEANARLIAAAPELLEALLEARPLLEALQAAIPLPDHDSAIGHGKALRMVRAAIAKAEGA